MTDFDDRNLTTHEGSAYGLLLSDLIQDILAHAHNPADCATHLSERLRALIGARTILIYEYKSAQPTAGYNLVSAIPDRRRTLGLSAAMLDFVARASATARLVLIHRQSDDTQAGTENSKLADMLVGLQLDSAVVVPLQYNSERIGTMLLLDLLDEHNISGLFQTLDRLSGVLALVLRNAALYANLENLVEERTAQLHEEARNLKQTLENNKILFREVHHRVKNNLQVIDSLLYLQGEAQDSDRVKAALADARGRISAMALVHAELYRAENLASVDLAAYIPSLVSSVFAAVFHETDIRYELDSVVVPLEVCIPCGLILNEVVTNAIKYALLEGPAAQVRVSLNCQAGSVVIIVKDNGPGLPAGLNPASGGNLGFSIIRSLAAQLRGQAEWHNRNGVEFILTFRMEQI